MIECVDKNGNHVWLYPDKNTEFIVTRKSTGEKVKVYFDTMIFQNDTLCGLRSRLIGGVRIIPVDDIDKVEISAEFPRTVNINNFNISIPKSSKEIDIPKYETKDQLNGTPFVYWKFCKQKEKQLGLKKPEISSDSLIFRIWITNPIGSKGQSHGLIEIRYDSLQWTGNLTLMRVDFNAKNLSETITKSKTWKLDPMKTNWETIVDSLFRLKIDVLPTDEQIPNYYTESTRYNNNSPTFSFEYATKEKYRFYQYGDIYRTPDKFWQPKNVIKILDLLEDEFQWNSKGQDYF
jgi:hypothetical protein